MIPREPGMQLKCQESFCHWLMVDGLVVFRVAVMLTSGQGDLLSTQPKLRYRMDSRV